MDLIRVVDPNAHGTFIFDTSSGRGMVGHDWNGEVTGQRYVASMNYVFNETITFSLDRESEPYYIAASVAFNQPSYSLEPWGDLNMQGLALTNFISDETTTDYEWCGFSCTLSDANGDTFRWLDAKGSDTGQDNGMTAPQLQFGFFGHWAFLPSGAATLTFDLRFGIRQYNFYRQDLEPGTLVGSIISIPEMTYVSRTSYVTPGS